MGFIAGMIMLTGYYIWRELSGIREELKRMNKIVETTDIIGKGKE